MAGKQIIDRAIRNGIINLRDVADELRTKEKEELIKRHHIWQGKNGSWYTKLNGRLIKKNAKWKVEDAILERSHELNPSVEDIFNEFIKFKEGRLQDSTILRYESTFRNHFDELRKQRVSEISAWDIEEWVVGVVEHTTAREFGNVRIILYAIFKMARKKGLIDFRVQEVVDETNLTSKDFKPKRNTKQVLTNEEYIRTTEYLKKHPDKVNLGLLLILVTGLRIGELCALSREDIGDGFINVRKMEIKTKQGYEIVERTKTETSNRKVYVPREYHWLLRKLKLNFGYVFRKDRGGMIRSRVFRYRLNKVCDTLGIERIGLHKLRKTYASRLLSKGADNFLIQSQLGHTDFTTTARHYIRDIMTEEEKIKQLEKVT